MKVIILGRNVIHEIVVVDVWQAETYEEVYDILKKFPLGRHTFNGVKINKIEITESGE